MKKLLKKFIKWIKSLLRKRTKKVDIDLAEVKRKEKEQRKKAWEQRLAKINQYQAKKKRIYPGHRWYSLSLDTGLIKDQGLSKTPLYGQEPDMVYVSRLNEKNAKKAFRHYGYIVKEYEQLKNIA